MKTLNRNTSLIAPPEGISNASSTFLQTAFNVTNVICGVSVLSLPYAFTKTGWIIGVCLLCLFGAVAGLCARLLSQIQVAHLRSTGVALLTYGDIGEAAFGKRGRLFIQFIFSCELFGASCALLLLASHTLSDLLPDWDPLTLKCSLWSLLTITTWPKSLSILSYGSMLGVLCLLNLIVALVVDGFTKHTAPGSLLEPAVTSVLPADWMQVPSAFGLLMAGFAGHACFPGLFASMKDSSNFGKAVTLAFTTGVTIYLIVASVGYLMFGVLAETMITRSLNDPDYYSWLYYLTMVLVAVNPSTKYPLCLYPVVMDLEIFIFSKLPRPDDEMERKQVSIHIDNHLRDDDTDDESITLLPPHRMANPPLLIRIKEFLIYDYTIRRVIFRTFVSSLVLVVAITFPSFDIVLSLLGSVFAMTSSVLFPILCYLSLFSDTSKNNDSPVTGFSFLADDRNPLLNQHGDINGASASRDSLRKTSTVLPIRTYGFKREKQLLAQEWWSTQQWKRICAAVTFVMFFIIGLMGTLWTLIPGLAVGDI